MVYHKTETEVNGHEITIQQVRGPDSSMGKSEVGLWINGYAVKIADKYDDSFDVPETFYPSDTYEVNEVKRFASFLVDNDLLICGKCRNTMPADSGVTFGFCDIKCDDCVKSDRECDDNEEHSWKCTNPRQKSNARLPTRYKCEKCGKTRKTTPTG